MDMKSLKNPACKGFAIAFAAVLACRIAFASVEELPQLPEGVLPNTEVVTNIALTVDLERLRKLSFSLALDASVSNSLSIAVGAAAEESLTLEEADFEWGYDCGKWFYAVTATGAVEEWPAAETGRVERVLTLGHTGFNPLWNRIRIVKRGLGDLHIESLQTTEDKKFELYLR